MDFSTFLRSRLSLPLPALDAHREFVPPLKNAEERLSKPPTDARRSAVLVPLIDTGRSLPSLLYELRSETLSTHKGQMSFPGGRTDPGETPSQTAIRELYEELGIPHNAVDVVGELSPLYIPPSNSAVVPVVATVEHGHEFVLNPAEVADIIIVPIEDIIDSSSIRRSEWILYGVKMSVPHWNVHPSVPLWGATAMITNELMWLAKEYLALRQ